MEVLCLGLKFLSILWTPEWEKESFVMFPQTEEVLIISIYSRIPLIWVPVLFQSQCFDS